MADIAALLQSVATLRQSVQSALARGDTAVLAETNRLMEELQQELDRQTIDLGLTSAYTSKSEISSPSGEPGRCFVSSERAPPSFFLFFDRR